MVTTSLKTTERRFFRTYHGYFLVHDASQKNSALTLERWAREIAQQRTFVAPDTQIPNPWMTSTRDPHVIYGFGGLPVPCLVVSNKRRDKARSWERRRGGIESEDGVWWVFEENWVTITTNTSNDDDQWKQRGDH